MSGSLSSPCLPRYGGRAGFVNAVLLAVALFAAMPAAAAAEELRLLALGDSLTAGYGLARRDAFPARLEQALRDAGHAVRVIDAGVSGDTTAGGRARLDWALADKPHAAIVELGANDGLRGLDPGATEANLDAIVGRLKAAGVAVLVAGMKAPPNLGREYGAAFDAVFAEVAARHGVALYPFFLDGVAADPALNQRDGIHPTAAGVQVIVGRLLPHVVVLLAGSR
jgi:acyl-CoA thioesterase-1